MWNNGQPVQNIHNLSAPDSVYQRLLPSFSSTTFRESAHEVCHARKNASGSYPKCQDPEAFLIVVSLSSGDPAVWPILDQEL